MTQDDNTPRPSSPRKPANGEPSGPSQPTVRDEKQASRRRDRVREPFRKESRRSGVQLTRTPDYLVVGHISADLQPDGSVILGGTALYSALTAASLGARVAVLTRGAFGQHIAGMDIPSLEPYLGDISIVVQEAEVPTTFINEYRPDRRIQTMPHWAGEIDLRGLPPHWRNAKVVHLGPIADELNPRETVGLTTQFLGMTPQGWMRDWPREAGGRVNHIPLKLPAQLLGRADCAVVSVEEITQAREVVQRVGERRLSVVTSGPDGARITAAGKHYDIPGLPVKVADLTGAGDVFAAAFFLRDSDRSISVQNAGRFANAVAAMSLRTRGAEGFPSLAEVEHVLKTNRV